MLPIVRKEVKCECDLKKKKRAKTKIQNSKKQLGSIIVVYKNTWLNKCVEINKQGQGRYRGNFLPLTKEEKNKTQEKTHSKSSTTFVTLWVHAHLKHHAGFLQQICSHVGPDDPVSVVEADLDVLPEATAVVVAGGLGVSDSLKERRKTQRVKPESDRADLQQMHFICLQVGATLSIEVNLYCKVQRIFA